VSELIATLWRPLAQGSVAAPAAPSWLVTLVALATAAMLLEALVLLAWYHHTGRGLPPRSLLPTLLAGGGLMGALLVALTGAPLAWLLGLLAVAGVAHVLDLQRRWLPGRAGR
jgi:hypothetical protein